MLARTLLIAFAAACTRPPAGPPGDKPTDTPASTPPHTETAVETSPDTATTGTTEPDTTTVDCASLPTGEVPYTALPISTQEDFDFDAEGMVVFMDGGMTSNLIGVDTVGNFQVIAVGLPDTRGISVLPDGNVVIAFFGDGRIGVVDRSTGITTPIVSGLILPNAVDVGDDGELYFTERSTVRRYDPATGETSTIGEGFYFPNGLSLDEDHDTLYVADNTIGIYRMSRLSDSEWSEPELVIEPAGERVTYDGIEVDACGNLYVVGYARGDLTRFDPATFTPTRLADIPGAGGFAAAHWGSGIGGWRRDVLYLTNRREIFAVEVGVPGRDQPVDLVP